LNFASRFAPFAVIGLPPAPILDYSVELFCEVYVNLSEVARVRADSGIAAANHRPASATELGISAVSGLQPPLIRISNRNSPELEFALSHLKLITSKFLIATTTSVWCYGRFKIQISNLQST